MKKTIVNSLRDDFIPFASDSLLNFLPSVCDGLLPVYRKVIYALDKNGITYEKSHIKMLRAAAMAMTYYVYGDLPLNQAMKNMGNNTLNYMYLDPKGSFGDKQKRDGVGASPRYIECKLSQYSEDLLDGIKKKNVPFKRNFDNTCDEPIVLPSTLPNILLNTTQSIATGESSKIPAHNLIEVCDAFISYIKTHDIEKSISILNGCDLSLGGQIVYDKATFESIYKTGRGSFSLVGKYRYDEKENSIHIYEIPYETYIEAIDDRVRQLYDKDKFKEITDIHDGSDKNGLNLVIYLKKGTNVKTFISKLRKLTPFESKMSCNFTCLDIDNKTPKLMSLEDIISTWIKHRKNCIKNELKYDINKYTKDRKLLLALKKILLDIDKTVLIVKNTNTEEETITKLINEFNIDNEEALYVSEVKLRNLNKTWINNRISKIGELTNKINELNTTLSSDEKIEDIIISQLENGKRKYGQPRKTEIIYNDDSDTNFDATTLIEDYNCNIVLTKQGYIKKTQRYSDTQKLKDGDSLLQQIKSTNKSKLLLFTDRANCYYLNTYSLSDSQPSSLGEYLPSMLQLENEHIIYVVSTTDYSNYMLFVYENGHGLKVPLKSYETSTNRTKTTNAYNTNSPLVCITYLENDEDYATVTEDKRYAVFNSSMITIKTSKVAQGNRLIKTENGKVVRFEPNFLSQLETDTCYYDKKLDMSGRKLKL